eukprot:1000267-Rhodomonas_salina.1
MGWGAPSVRVVALLSAHMIQPMPSPDLAPPFCSIFVVLFAPHHARLRALLGLLVSRCVFVQCCHTATPPFIRSEPRL